MSSVFPIRCFTCNKVVANLEQKYKEMLEEKGKLTMADFNTIGITRYCCIRMFMGYVKLNVYSKKQEEKKTITSTDNITADYSSKKIEKI